MTASDLPDWDEMKIQMQKRIAELEKANQDLRAENIALKRNITKGKRTEYEIRLRIKKSRNKQEADALQLHTGGLEVVDERAEGRETSELYRKL